MGNVESKGTTPVFRWLLEDRIGGNKRQGITEKAKKKERREKKKKN